MTGTTLKVGAKRTGDTVVVFADIGKSADKGTFQGGWIETSDGGVFGPHRADICELWGEWKLTVSWTRSTYVDGQLVSRESGGFSKGGLFSLPGIVSTDAAPSGMWQQLGFSNAQAGARGVAMQYRVPAAELAQAPMNIVIHVTRPSQKMVDTVPFDLVMTEGPDGIALTQAPPEEDAACPPDEGSSAGMDEGAVASGPETPPTSLSGKTRVAGAESVGGRTPPPDPKPESGTPRRDPPLKDDGGSVFIGLPPPEGAQYHSVEREPKPRYFTVERAPPIRYHSVERDAADSGNVALVEIDATACTKGVATATPANSTVTIACTPTPGATKAELVVCGKPGNMVDRARLCVTEPVPGAVKSFAFPHVLEQTGGSSSNQFSFDTSFSITYAAGLQAPATGCGTQVDVFLFDPATDGTVTKPVSPSSAVKLLPICVDALSSGAQTGEGLLVPFGPDFGGAVSAGTVIRGLDTDRTARDIGVRFSW
ncbi:MAG: hypothetical protein B7Y97_06925 [Sphingomonas sp. 32-66-10]|nr:MAG: hypothetical protein B7Y97_06925 [Sphingomonas sp. 32-66-10]